MPVTDLWQKARFESGRVNQGLFGEIVRIDKTKEQYAYIYTEDNYGGWVRRDHLREIAEKEKLYATAIVKAPVADIYRDHRSGSVISRLSFGSRVNYVKKYRKRIKLQEPSGWIDVDNLLLSGSPRMSGTNLLRTLRSFLGVPYLWGGRSGFGLDCSGLVQLVYGYFGIFLPRDTKDQVLNGKRVAQKNIKPGDLIFSPGHVCISMGRGRIIHASLRAGGVKIESLSPSAGLYRKDIADKITQVRRVL